ncbi:zinc-binding dehydrogenase [Amycolatopsis sp. VS8301801F10]|uniref:zinc-binding dehydrogenase n=1 Tax=Amycolatopsis sp. VS8301801F10 TaxID=2652442 RepID=UPI0038FC1015
MAAELGGQRITSDRSSPRLRELLDLCALGEFRVAVRKEYPLAASTHRETAAGHGRGKVVLRIG